MVVRDSCHMRFSPLYHFSQPITYLTNDPISVFTSADQFSQFKVMFNYPTSIECFSESNIGEGTKSGQTDR